MTAPNQPGQGEYLAPNAAFGGDDIALGDHRQSIAKAVYEPAPGPADLDAVYSGYVERNHKEAARILAVPDGSLESLGVTAVPHLRLLAAPYLKQRESINAEYEGGLLTPEGKRQKLEQVRESYQRDVTEKVVAPLEDALNKTAQFYAGLPEAAPASEDQRRRAVLIADEMQRLSPKQSIPIAETAVRDAIRTEDTGTLRALVPYLQDLRDRELERADKDPSGAGTNNGARVNGLLTKVQTVLQSGFKTLWSEARLRQIGLIRYQLESLAQAAIESGGDLDSHPTFRMRKSVQGRPGSFPMLDHFVRETE